MFLDDELGGCSDDDFEPIPLMDGDYKEALLDNEDAEDEGDNVEENSVKQVGTSTPRNYLFAKSRLRKNNGDENVKKQLLGNLDYIETAVTETLNERS